MKKDFNADVNQLIQLVTHSIYSNPDIFLRELLSNASDALAKAKIKSLQDTDYLGDDHELNITVDLDQDKKIITITDNGIGMSKDDVINNIGTIAKSGTKEFVAKLTQAKSQAAQSNNPDNTSLIGQFGIGFYSVFMVADHVELETKTATEDAVLWISEGKGSYDIKESKKETRGTIIRIHLKEDNHDLANHHRIQSLIKKHSNYVPFPIMMLEAKDDKDEKKQRTYEQINQAQSLWSKQKSTIKDEQYQEFYKSISFDQNEPLDHLHLHIEGNINYKALLFIPSQKSPFQSLMPDQDYGPSLYVQSVLIMEQSKELLPQWLRFIKGVVETPDLPLNVSREILQNNALITKISSSLIKKTLDTLARQLTNERKKYQTFLDNFGTILKEGIHFDRNHKETIAGLITFHSYQQDQKVTFNEYIGYDPQTKKKDEDKKENKEEKTEDKTPIYYLTGTSVDQLKNSPYLEQFKGTKHDVLLMTDPIDEWVIQALPAYQDHKLINAQTADLSTESQDKEIKKKSKETAKLNKEHKNFLAFTKATIGKDVIDNIELTHKLTDSLAVLVNKDGQPSVQMEKYMAAMGQNIPTTQRDFQLNANHPLTTKMLALYDADPKDPTLADLVSYTYQQALLLHSGNIPNPVTFLQTINNLLA